MIGQLQSAVLFLVALVGSISVHEFSHAWSANQLGDPTARNQGRMTLNPLVHFDPIGALMVVFMAFAGWGIGWGKPVPVNPYNLRGGPRVSMGLTAAAGPFSNLVLAALFAVPLRLAGSLPGLLQSFLWTMVFTNVTLAVFNLIPLPPLDGFNVFQGLLGTFRTRWAYEVGALLDRIASYGSLVLLALLYLLGRIMGPPTEALLQLLLGF
jgi:Zn-dependent protease